MGKGSSKNRPKTTRSLDMKDSSHSLYGSDTLFNDINNMTNFKKKESIVLIPNAIKQGNLMRSPLVRFSMRKPKFTTASSDISPESKQEFHRDNMDLLELTKNHLKKSLDKQQNLTKNEIKYKTITEEYMKNVKKQLDWNLDQNFEQELISPRLFLNKINTNENITSEILNPEESNNHKKMVGLNHDELIRLYKENRRHIKSSSGPMSYGAGELEQLKHKASKQQRPSNMGAQNPEEKGEKEPKRRIKKLETQTYNDMDKFKKFTASISTLIGKEIPKPLPRIKIRGSSEEFLKEGGMKIVSSTVMEKIVEVMVTEEKLEESEINKNLISTLVQNKFTPSDYVMGDKEKLLQKIQEKYRSLHSKRKPNVLPDMDSMIKSKKDVKLLFNFPSESETKHGNLKKNQQAANEIVQSPLPQKKRREAQNFSRMNNDKKHKTGLTLKSLAKGVMAINFWDRLMKKDHTNKSEGRTLDKDGSEKFEIISHLDPSEKSSNNSIIKSPNLSRRNSGAHEHLRVNNMHEPQSSTLMTPSKNMKKLSFLNIISPRDLGTQVIKSPKDVESLPVKKPAASPRGGGLGSFLLSLSPKFKKNSMRLNVQDQPLTERGPSSPFKKVE